MNDVRTITAGIDGSAASLDAADWAAREADRRRLALRLLYAGGEPPPPVRVPDVDLPAGPARTALGRAAVQLAYAHPALDILARRTGPPAVPALLDAARESEALVLGSRVRNAVTGFLTGSVVLGVAARAERPVVLVRSGELPQDERVPVGPRVPPYAAPYRPVVLGLDLDRPAEQLTGYAFDAAAVRAAPLRVLHVRTPAPPAGLPRAARAPGGTATREAPSGALDGVLQPWRHKFPDTEVDGRVLDGHPVHHLLRAAARASLLVIGRRLSAGPGLGPVARSLIRHAACPVVVVPHE